MRKKDLTGQRFGRLTVTGENPSPYISPAGKPFRRWDCVCDCGKRVTVLQNALTSAHSPTQSCGCSRHLVNQDDRFEDLTGRRFGRMTVINPAPLEKPEANGNLTGWHCRCDCGNEVIVPRRALVSQGLQSCGCLRTEKAANRLKDDVGQFHGTTLSAIQPARASNKNSKSGIKGVYWNEREKRWIAKIEYQGKSITIGRFDTPEAAKKARDEKEEEIFGAALQEHAQTPRWTLKAPDGTVYQTNSLHGFCEREYPELFDNPKSAACNIAALSNRRRPGSYKGWTIVYRKRKNFSEPPEEGDFDIRTAREAAGMTQAQLAAIIGVDNTQVSRWEAGKHKPMPAMLEKIKNALEK